jgi:hypothetical protein
LLVEVAFNHGKGRWWVVSHLVGGEVWENGHSIGVDGIAPRREGWREHVGVDEGDTVCFGSVSVDGSASR